MSPDAVPALRIAELTLADFRNYAHLSLAFEPGLNILEGPNGAGKTNILEAVSYLALARSPRARSDAELVRRGCSGFSLRASVRADGEENARTLGISYGHGRPKTALVQNAPPTRVSALYGQLLVTLFTPDDLWLLKGPPAARRSLLDRLLVQSSPLYAHAAIRYRQALSQRNATLREVRARRASTALLAAWEPQLVQYGAEMLARRALAVAALQPAAAAAQDLLSGGREPLALRYVPSLADVAAAGPDSGDRPRDAAAWSEVLREGLRRTVAADIARASTLCGPHRDDVQACIGGWPAGAHASQGQQRSAVLALKFAERDFLRRSTGRLPVLLVDDVLSELDPARRDLLSHLLLKEGQVLLTTVDVHLPDGLAAAARFSVHDASVQNRSGAGT